MTVAPRQLAFAVAMAAGMLGGVSATAGSNSLRLDPPIAAAAKAEVLKGVRTRLLETAYAPGVDFSKWDRLLAEERESVAVARTVGTFSEAVNRVLGRFGVSHLQLSPPGASGAAGVTSSLGASLEKREDGLAVVTTVPGSPATRAGLVAGDLILEVNGVRPTSVTGLTGSNGPLRLKVRRAMGTIAELTLAKTTSGEAHALEMKWPAPDTAILSVASFGGAYDSQRLDELMREAVRAKALLIDLRGNSGGDAFNVAHFLGRFVPERTPFGAYVTQELARGYEKANRRSLTNYSAFARWSPQKLRAMKSPLPPFRGRVAVLVNGGTASGGEMAAQALRELRDAPVIGAPTAGAVLGGVWMPLTHGFNLRVPVLGYVSIGGATLDGYPIVPDRQVDSGPASGKSDPALAAALGELKDEPGGS